MRICLLRNSIQTFLILFMKALNACCAGVPIGLSRFINGILSAKGGAKSDRPPPQILQVCKHRNRLRHQHGIEPAAAALAAGDGGEFVAAG
jgi:hypothetical protein